MAYEAEQQDQDKKNQNGAQSGSGGMLSFGATPNPISSNEGKQQTSGSWANLQNYLDANQDQAAGMGEKVASGISQDINTASQSFKGAQDEFNKAPTTDLSKSKESVDQILSKPTLANDQDVSQFQGIKNGSYKGPKSIQDTSGWATASSDAQKAQNTVDLSGSEAGRQTLLTKQYARPDYSQGAKTLDQMLIQRNSDAQKKIQDSTHGWEAINQAISAAPQSTAMIGAQRMHDAQAASDYAKTRGDDATNALTQAIGNRVANKSSERDQVWKALTSDMTDTAWDPKTMEALGVQSGQKLYNVDPNRYLAEAQSPTKETVATPEEVAQYLALSKIMGVDPTYITPDAAKNAGTYGAPFSFDKAGFMGAVDQAQKNYLNDMNALNIDQYGQQRYVNEGNSAFSYGPKSWNNDWSNDQKIKMLSDTRDSFRSGSPQWQYYQGAIDKYNAIQNLYTPNRVLESNEPKAYYVPKRPMIGGKK